MVAVDFHVCFIGLLVMVSIVDLIEVFGCVDPRNHIIDGPIPPILWWGGEFGSGVGGYRSIGRV